MDMEPDIDNRNVKNLVLCYKNIKYTVQQGTFKKLFYPMQILPMVDLCAVCGQGGGASLGCRPGDYKHFLSGQEQEQPRNREAGGRACRRLLG